MNKVAAIDFDDFLARTDDLNCPPNEHWFLNTTTIKLMETLKEDGYLIYIHTSRNIPGDLDIIRDMLKKENVPFDDIVGNKFRADVYYGNNYFNTAFIDDITLENAKVTPELFNVIRNHYDEHLQVFKQLTSLINFQKLHDAIRELIVTKGTLYCGGNGGSFSVSQHFTADLMNTTEGAIRTYALCQNAAYLTALANDFGYEEVFSKELNDIGVSKKDVVLFFSVSGTSKNVLRGVEKALEKGCNVYLVTTFLNYPLYERIFNNSFEGRVNVLKLDVNGYQIPENMFSILSHILINSIKRLL